MKHKLASYMHAQAVDSSFWTRLQKLLFRCNLIPKYRMAIDASGTLWSCGYADTTEADTAAALNALNPNCKIGTRVSWGRKVFIGS